MLAERLCPHGLKACEYLVSLSNEMLSSFVPLQGRIAVDMKRVIRVMSGVQMLNTAFLGLSKFVLVNIIILKNIDRYSKN